MSQDKILPGTYINFVSVASASSVLSDRGIATMPLELDWGKEGEVFEVSNEDFQKDSQKIFGYAHDHEKMNGLSDLFMNAKTLYAYRLNGGGTKATNAFATALYGGTRGNDIKIVIQANADETSKYDVMTYLETARVDTQTVAQASELVAKDRSCTCQCCRNSGDFCSDSSTGWIECGISSLSFNVDHYSDHSYYYIDLHCLHSNCKTDGSCEYRIGNYSRSTFGSSCCNW